MTVNVTEDQDLLLFNLSDLVHEFLRMVDLWVELSTRHDPLSVEIDTGKRAPIVATYDTIWVHAGDQAQNVGAHN